MNLRTVTAEHNFLAVQRPGEVVAGVQCWETVGSVQRSRRGSFYIAYDAGGQVIGHYEDMGAAVEAVALRFNRTG